MKNKIIWFIIFKHKDKGQEILLLNNRAVAVKVREVGLQAFKKIFG
jgi:hypothetical protein